MNTINISKFFKGIAIFMVVLCHIHQTFTLPFYLNDIFSFFQVGTQLFMLLSAMGLCFSHSKQPLPWHKFMWKRASKIGLQYWFAIAIAAVYRVAFAIISHEPILQKLNPLGIIINMSFLHGFFGDKATNNEVVRGGWFIGTLFIFYAIFPLIYRLYFTKNKKWEQVRVWLFPLTAFIVTSVVVTYLNFLEMPSAYRNIFVQFAPFCLGFSLYELQKTNNIENIRLPLIKGLFFTVLSIALYFTKTKVDFFYIFSIGVGFTFFIIYAIQNNKVCNAINSDKKGIIRFFNRYGTYSFPIYLTHSYLVFDFCFIATTVLSKLHKSELLWFIVLLPIVVVAVYVVGMLFEKIVSFTISIISKKEPQKSKATSK